MLRTGMTVEMATSHVHHREGGEDGQSMRRLQLLKLQAQERMDLVRMAQQSHFGGRMGVRRAPRELNKNFVHKLAEAVSLLRNGKWRTDGRTWASLPPDCWLDAPLADAVVHE